MQGKVLLRSNQAFIFRIWSTNLYEQSLQAFSLFDSNLHKKKSTVRTTPLLIFFSFSTLSAEIAVKNQLNVSETFKYGRIYLNIERNEILLKMGIPLFQVFNQLKICCQIDLENT